MTLRDKKLINRFLMLALNLHKVKVGEGGSKNMQKSTEMGQNN